MFQFFLGFGVALALVLLVHVLVHFAVRYLAKKKRYASAIWVEPTKKQAAKGQVARWEVRGRFLSVAADITSRIRAESIGTEPSKTVHYRQ